VHNHSQLCTAQVYGLRRIFFVSTFAVANKICTGKCQAIFALPRKSAAPQQSQKASFRFVFGLRDL
jgi:hypothetical protein